MKILIKITKEVLERSMFCGIDPQTGINMSSLQSDTGRNCAIGNAICDLFQNAWVSNESVWIFDKVPDYSMAVSRLSRIKILLPRIATNFIYAFDHKSPEGRVDMQPFSFEIDVPKEVIEMIGIGEVYKVLSESRTLELVHP